MWLSLLVVLKLMWAAFTTWAVMVLMSERDDRLERERLGREQRDKEV